MKPSTPEEENHAVRLSIGSRERNTVTTASARVQIVVEIDAKSTWSNDTTVAQIDQQALDDIASSIGHVFKLAREANIKMRLVGEPAVVNIELKSSKR